MTNTLIVVSCPICGGKSYVKVPTEGYKKFQKGAHVQDVFPDLSTDERELLITGIDTECWRKTFGDT